MAPVEAGAAGVPNENDNGVVVGAVAAVVVAPAGIAVETAAGNTLVTMRKDFCARYSRKI